MAEDSKGQILIVDDTPENLQVLGTLLRAEEYRVSVAMNGAECLQRARANPPEWPLVAIERMTTEGPRHRVRITKPFRLGRHEVTVGQFRQFVDQTGYKTVAERDGRGGYGFADGKLKRLTNSNPWLGEVALGRQEVVRFKARDELEIEGLLIHPVGCKKDVRYPLVIVAHGVRSKIKRMSASNSFH